MANTRLQLRLGEVLEEQGLSHAEFARKVGCTKANVSYLCSGRRSPTLRTISNLATELRVPWRTLIRVAK